MSIVDVIVGSIIIALLIFSSTSTFGFVKDYLVDAENYYEANKFSMQTIEDIQAWPYSDNLRLKKNTPSNPSYSYPLPADGNPSKVRDIFSGTRVYEVADKKWGTSPDDYKEIKVTTTWSHKGVNNKFVSLWILRRDDGS